MAFLATRLGSKYQQSMGSPRADSLVGHGAGADDAPHLPTSDVAVRQFHSMGCRGT